MSTSYRPPLNGYQSQPLELYEGHYPDAGCDCKGCIRDRGVEVWLATFVPGHAPGEGCDGKTCSAARVANGGRLPDELDPLDEEVFRRLRKLRGEEEVPEARALVGAGPYRSMPLAPPARAPLKGWKLFKHKLRRLWWAFLLWEQGRFRKRWPNKCARCGTRSKQWVVGWRLMGPGDPKSDIEPTYACPLCQADNTPEPWR